MDNDEIELKLILLNYERLLLTDAIRVDQERISELLDIHFKEYTSSGKIYQYTAGDIFGVSKEKIQILESSFEVIQLSSDIALVNYQTIKEGKDKEIKVNRSSIWRKTENTWKIVFHQGTISIE